MDENYYIPTVEEVKPFPWGFIGGWCGGMASMLLMVIVVIRWLP